MSIKDLLLEMKEDIGTHCLALELPLLLINDYQDFPYDRDYYDYSTINKNAKAATERFCFEVVDKGYDGCSCDYYLVFTLKDPKSKGEPRLFRLDYSEDSYGESQTVSRIEEVERKVKEVVYYEPAL